MMRIRPEVTWMFHLHTRDQLCGCTELRQMRIKADTDKKEAALAVSSMQTIEAAAREGLREGPGCSASLHPRQW